MKIKSSYKIIISGVIIASSILIISAIIPTLGVIWWSSYDPRENQTVSDSCPVIHFLNYAWQDCGTIWTWSILGIPFLAVITSPVGIILAFVIWRVRK